MVQYIKVEVPDETKKILKYRNKKGEESYLNFSKPGLKVHFKNK